MTFTVELDPWTNYVVAFSIVPMVGWGVVFLVDAMMIIIYTSCLQSALTFCQSVAIMTLFSATSCIYFLHKMQ